MSRQQHTHRGHCQACGAVQAITLRGSNRHGSLGVIAKHGYKVAWGYFNGTCGGSDHQPLERDRMYLDSTRKAMLVYAINEATRARKLRNREPGTEPETVVTGQEKNPQYRVSYTVMRIPRYIDVKTAWADCTPEQRDRWYSTAINTAELNARSAKRHREFLKELAERVHGKEPIAVVHKPKVTVTIGMEFERHGIKWKINSDTFTAGMGRGTQYVRAIRLGEQHMNPTLNKCTLRVSEVRKALGG